MPLDRPGWIFDLDGTLTVPQHDFDAIRAELGLRPAEPILEQLAELSPADAAPLHERLGRIERELAAEAQPQPGAAELLAELVARGARLGILTRNLADLAHIALAACGLGGLFDAADVLGRDDAPPKPSPAGLLRISSRWGLPPGDCVFVGDYLFDLQAGRAAGMLTIHLASRGGDWPDVTDRRVGRLDELLQDPAPC